MYLIPSLNEQVLLSLTWCAVQMRQSGAIWGSLKHQDEFHHPGALTIAWQLAHPALQAGESSVVAPDLFTPLPFLEPAQWTESASTNWPDHLD